MYMQIGAGAVAESHPSGHTVNAAYRTTGRLWQLAADFDGQVAAKARRQFYKNYIVFNDIFIFTTWKFENLNCRRI